MPDSQISTAPMALYWMFSLVFFNNGQHSGCHSCVTAWYTTSYLAPKRFSNVLIPKGATTDIHLISFIEEIETFLSIYIGQHIPDGFEKVDNLSNYINAYRKGKSSDGLTLAHILTLRSKINPHTVWLLLSVTTNRDYLTEPLWNSFI